VTLSVGETAKRLDVSADTVRNYTEQGLLRCVRTRGNHRRIPISSIRVFENHRKPDQTDALPEELPTRAREPEDEFEIYYVRNDRYPNHLEPGYICNVSHIRLLGYWDGPSSTVPFLAQIFGGGVFVVRRVRDGVVVHVSAR
jgi:excisionase family DNA binding protein